MKLRLRVNGTEHDLDDLWAFESLLFVLRERVGLRGTKNACEQGECGSCAVYLDGTLVCACLVAAGQADGADVLTVEGLSDTPGELHPIQDALLESGGVQCGFCTPGVVMSMHALLRAHPRPDEMTVREEMSGNLCRCTGYQAIIDAVSLAAERLGERA